MSVNVQASLSATAGPQQVIVTAPNPVDGFGSVSVYNNTNSNVLIYFGRTGGFGSPDLVVQAQSIVTYPCPGTPYFTAVLQTFPTTGNVCTINAVDAVLSSSSSLIPGSVGSPGIPPSAIGFAGEIEGLGYIQWVNATCTQLPSNDGASSSFVVIPASPYPGTSTYVYSISIAAITATLNSFPTPPSATISTLRLCSASTGGTIFSLWNWTNNDKANFAALPTSVLGEFSVAISGGPLPLFETSGNIYAFYSDNDSANTVNASQLWAGVNVAFAYF